MKAQAARSRESPIPTEISCAIAGYSPPSLRRWICGTRSDVWQSPELTAFHPIFKMVAELIPDPKPARWAANGRDAELGDTWNNYQDKIWLKSVSFEEGVQQLQKESQAVLDKPED